MPDTAKKDTIKHNSLTWENIVSPTQETVDYLSRKHKFHHLDLEDILSKIQRPKIDEYEKYLFIVLHFPYWDTETDSIKQDEVDIFIANSFIITISPGNKNLNSIFSKLKRRVTLRRQYMSKSTGFLLYNIIDEMFAGCFNFIDKLTDEIDDIEKDVFSTENPKDMLKDILSIKKDIITFRRIIIPQRALIPQLEHKNKRFLPEDLEVYFDDIVDKVERIYNNLETLKEIVASLNETNESILSHNTNNIIKVLTIFSVIMLPLTFITGVYGMNLKWLPIADNPSSFLMLGGLFVVIVLIMLLIFKFKKWI